MFSVEPKFSSARPLVEEPPPAVVAHVLSPLRNVYAEGVPVADSFEIPTVAGSIVRAVPEPDTEITALYAPPTRPALLINADIF